MFDDEFDQHIEAAEKFFPSLLNLKKIENIHAVLNEMTLIFESQSKGKSPLDDLPKLIKLRDELVAALRESIEYTIVSEALDRSETSGKSEQADTSIAEGPKQFYNSLNNAIGEMCTTTAIKKLSIKLRKFTGELKPS